MTVWSAQITLKDVARRAKCSTAVVSTVVNNAKGNTLVSQEMRQRVLKAAQDLGYQPNFASRSLARRRTGTLGVYIPPAPWSGPGFNYEGTILRGVEAACRDHAYDLLLINLSGAVAPEVCLRKFAERRIDGLLLIHVEPGSPWVPQLLNINPNVVAVDYPKPEPQLDAIVFDNNAVSRLAVEHLKSLGHQKIGFIGSCRQPQSVDALIRYEGYLQAMRDLALEIRPEWVFDLNKAPTPLRPEDAVCQMEGQMAAEHIIRLGSDGPTAWLAYGDFVAVHAMARLRTAGIRVPEDISLMGVDDSDWCTLVTPNLTSVCHPLVEMGQRAAEMLITRSERAASGESRTAHAGRHIVYPPSLVVRDSTRSPRGKES